MTSSKDHTDDGTELAQDETTEMAFVTQAHYECESHRDLTTEIIFAIAAAEDVAPTEDQGATALRVCRCCVDRRRLLWSPGRGARTR